jgi:hypothetical protein
VHICREIANTWLLHHSNPPSNTSIAVREFLAQNNITTLPHPLYSHDLAPCDFFLFPKLITHLRGHQFGIVENVQAAMMSGSNAGIAVFDQKEPILKGINCNCMYVQ